MFYGSDPIISLNKTNTEHFLQWYQGLLQNERVKNAIHLKWKILFCFNKILLKWQFIKFSLVYSSSCLIYSTGLHPQKQYTSFSLVYSSSCLLLFNRFTSSDNNIQVFLLFTPPQVFFYSTGLHPLITIYKFFLHQTEIARFCCRIIGFSFTNYWCVYFL